jgi:hypothetical protein
VSVRATAARWGRRWMSTAVIAAVAVAGVAGPPARAAVAASSPARIPAGCPAASAAALAASIGGASAGASTAGGSAGVSDWAADLGSARTRARACGHRVEVGASRTEQARTFANPDGTSTLEVSAVPLRIKRTDGSWTPVDTTLRWRADGSVAPVAVSQPLTLSGGGSTPLVRTVAAGHGWSLSWPVPLPKPRLEADTAVYPEVLPGVDLRVRALTTGFRYLLVVRTRAALADPRLRRIAVTVAGTALRQGSVGAEAVTPDGTVVLSTGAALMWDSGDATGPADDSRTAPVAISVAGQSLVLVPDSTMLTDPGARLPLYLDPQVSGRNRWAYSDSTNANRDDGIARVGLNPDGSGVYRSFFEFPMGSVAGTHILASTVNTTLIHSWSCGGSPVSLYWTDGIPGGVNGTRISWATGLAAWLDEQSGHAHKPSTGSGCAGDPQPDQPMQFNNQLTPRMQGWANARVGAVTLGLSTMSQNGTNEGTADRWKKFSVASTVLVINYNSYPGTPDASALSAVGTSQTVGCYTGAVATQPRLNATGGVHLRAALTDNDSGDNVIGRFEWQDVTSGAAAVVLPDTPGFPTPHTFDVSLPATALADGHSLRWRVHGWDHTDNGAASAWCEFAVDNATPGQPVLTSTELPAFPATPPATTVVGAAAAVTATPAAGDTDVVGYYVGTGQVETAPTVWIPAAANGTVRIPVVPVVSGLAKNFLTVVAVDAAGNRSPVPVSAPNAPGTRQFRANPGTVHHVHGDVTGDGRRDVVGMVDAGNNQTKLLTFDSTSDGSTVFNPLTSIVNDPNAFPAARLTRVSGDFNGDGLTDVAAFRDDGPCRTSLWWWLSNSNSYVPANTALWDSGAGNWCFTNGSKVVAGDFTGDGKDDIGAFYNYNGGRVALWVFVAKPDGTGFYPGTPWWDSGPGTWDWNNFKAVAGDFDGDGKVDIAQMYDYTNCSTAVFRFTSTGSSMIWPVQTWKVAAGNWCMANTTQILAGDFNGDGMDDLDAIYNYGNGVWKVFTFMGPNLPASLWTGNNSGPSDAPSMKAVLGDFNGDGLADLGHFYDVGAGRTGFWLLYSNGTAYSGENLKWDSANAGGLEWSTFSPM